MTTRAKLWRFLWLFLSPFPRYIFLDRQPFAFWWVDEPPYTVIRKICYENGVFCDDFEGVARLDFRVVDLLMGRITNVYEYDNGHIALTFIERRGADGHPHPNGGADWVEVDLGLLR